MIIIKAVKIDYDHTANSNSSSRKRAYILHKISCIFYSSIKVMSTKTENKNGGWNYGICKATESL